MESEFWILDDIAAFYLTYFQNPGLFHGLCFYIYKNTAFNRDGLKLNKKDLCVLIRLGDGEVLMRDPNPDMVDPLDNPIRFHAKLPSHKLILTSHVVLFGDGNVPPRKHNFPHVKSLRVDWLVECALNFGLCDPDAFLT